MDEAQIEERAKLEHYRSICRDALRLIAKLGGSHSLETFERVIRFTHEVTDGNPAVVRGKAAAIELFGEDLAQVKTPEQPAEQS